MAIPKQLRFLTKKRKSSSNFFTLHDDLLHTILKFLPFDDKLNFKSTCSSWHSVAKLHIKSVLISAKNNSSPLLLMPTDPEDTEKHDFLYDIVNNVQLPLNMPEMSHCIGSSKGWLILLKNKVDMFMFNPILDLKIHLPAIFSFPDFDYNPMNLSEHWISKAVIFGDPILDQNYGVAVIYNSVLNSKIAFAKHGDKKWTRFQNSDEDYSDIILCNGLIYALSGNNFVEAWYIDCSTPVKVEAFETVFHRNVAEFKDDSRGLYVSQRYLVESKGEISLVIRVVGEFVNGNDEPVYESDLNDMEICPYKTKNFYVFKLDYKKRVWIEVENLGDEMLFVGGNQSMSISTKGYANCKENSIYFSDDYWLRMDEDYSYGGHDMGIFDMKDRSFKEIYECELDSRMTPAFWILPC